MIPSWGNKEISWEEKKREIEEILEKAALAGIDKVLNPGVAWEDMENLLDLGKSFPRVFLAVGIHPHEAKTWEEGSIEKLKEFAKDPKVRAIGEIGLDYHYDLSPREAMQRAFSEQIELAIFLKLPLIVHSREAHEDTLRILQSSHAEEIGGIMHCFSGSLDLARAAMKLNFDISFSGSLTFANATRLREIAKNIPLEKTLIETDAPYMAPVPFRGKRCEPAYVVKVAEKLAEIHSVPLEEVIEKTTRNAERIFRI